MEKRFDKSLSRSAPLAAWKVLIESENFHSNLDPAPFALMLVSWRVILGFRLIYTRIKEG